MIILHSIFMLRFAKATNKLGERKTMVTSDFGWTKLAKEVVFERILFDLKDVAFRRTVDGSGHSG